MKQGHLQAIFATSTVAAGVNFPARTIVLMNSDLFNGHEFSPLGGTEFHQMTGRAGRRGQDRVGFMLAVPGRFMDLIHIRKLLFTETGGDREPDPERLLDDPEPPPFPDAGGHPGDLREIPGGLPAAPRTSAGAAQENRRTSGAISSGTSASSRRRVSWARTTA